MRKHHTTNGYSKVLKKTLWETTLQLLNHKNKTKQKQKTKHKKNQILCILQVRSAGAVNNATSLRNLVVFMESTYLEGERKKQFSLHEASSSKFHYSLKH